MEESCCGTCEFKDEKTIVPKNTENTDGSCFGSCELEDPKKVVPQKNKESCCGPCEFDDPKTIVPPANLNELIDQLRKVFSKEKVNVEYVQTLMTSYKSNREDWGKYAIFDDHKYTRNLVDQGNGKYNLIVLCWNYGQGSSIHSHANSHCFMKMLDGTLQEEQFEWPKEGQEVRMDVRNINNYKRDVTAYICDELGLHRVSNTSNTEQAISLHLYSPPFMECKCFDQQTGHEHTGRMTFYSKDGNLCEASS